MALAKWAAGLIMGGMSDTIAVESWPHPIPVSERLPDNPGPVFAYGTAPGAERPTWWHCFCFSKGKEWKVIHGYTVISNVSHWLPLPPAP